MTSLVFASLGRDNGEWDITDRDSNTIPELTAIWAEALELGGYTPSNEYQEMLNSCERWRQADFVDCLLWDIQVYFDGGREIIWSTKSDIEDEMLSAAFEGGIEHMLDAYYSGVNAEDIAPDWIEVADFWWI